METAITLQLRLNRRNIKSFNNSNRCKMSIHLLTMNTMQEAKLTEYHVIVVEENSYKKHYKSILKFVRKYLYKKGKHLILKNIDRLKMKKLKKMSIVINQNNKNKLNQRNLFNNLSEMKIKKLVENNQKKQNGRLRVKCSDKQ